MIVILKNVRIRCISIYRRMIFTLESAFTGRKLFRDWTYYYGLFAEYYVVLYYILRGYSLLHHRWKAMSGELDLVFINNDELLFCEVKARSIDFDKIYVKDAQRQRIFKTADYFICKNPMYARYQRAFVVAVVKFPKILTMNL